MADQPPRTRIQIRPLPESPGCYDVTIDGVEVSPIGLSIEMLAGEKPRVTMTFAPDDVEVDLLDSLLTTDTAI